MENAKPRVNALILQVVENQLRDNTPPETKQTLDRLLGAGYGEEDAKHLIGSAIAAEMRYVVENSKPFDVGRYRELLANLPDLTEA